MPDPKTNAEGKVYPWAIEEYDYSSYKGLMHYGIMMQDNALIIGKAQKKQMEDAYGRMTSDLVVDADGEDLHADSKVIRNVVGGEIITTDDVEDVSLSIPGDKITNFYTAETKPQAVKEYETIKGLQQEISADLRVRYAGKTDPRSRQLNTYANEYADLLDLQSANADPEAGNYIKACYDAPYITTLKSQEGGSPRFGTIGFENCIDIMNPADGKHIYEDYMTIIGSGEREQKIQYDRQKMEQEGPWNADKEAAYLNALRSEHQKTIEAYDRLWELEDHNQYDQALNNHLDHMVGKDASNTRDAGDAVGYMRGEVQAMDLGYDSKHLYILGKIGMADQTLKKRESELNRKIAEKVKEIRELPEESAEEKEKAERELKDFRGKMDHLNEYRKEFSEFKNTVWGKEVNSKEEMEAVEKQTEDFYRDHQEKFADIQNRLGKPNAGLAEAYQKEEAQKAPLIRSTEKPFVSNANSDLDIVRDSVMSAERKIIANEVPKMAAITGFMPFFTSRDRQSEMIERVGSIILRSSLPDNRKPDYTLEENFEKECKTFMADVAVDIKKGLKESGDDRYPRVESFKNEISNLADRYMDEILKGTPETEEYGKVATLIPQLNGDMFRPENIEQTNEILKDYPLDEYIKKGLAIDKLQREYSKAEKAGLSPEARDTYQKALREMREDYMDLAKDLHEKSLNPSPEILSLFGEEKYLMSKANGFIGDRGLGKLIENYDKDFAKTPITDQQLSTLDASLDKFNTKRNFFAGKESPEHRALREGVENIRDDLKELQSGMVDDGQGKKRPMTAEEKIDKLSDMVDKLNDLSSAAKDYIDHSVKDGKAPSTGAGASRLEGAKEIKDLLNQMQEVVGKEQALTSRMQIRRETKELQKQEEIKANTAPASKEPVKEEQKQENRRRMSLNDMMKDEKKNQPQKPKHERVSVPVQQNTVQTERTKGK